ncbi:MAG TPA: protein kinase [Pyrinomonadaceae bacterium]
MSLPEGTQLGRYEIHSQIGSGGMGEVYLAEDLRLKRKVALKLLPAELTDNKDRLRRFEQEARSTSALNHPNIVTIHEIGAESGRHFIATEFVEGSTLREQIKSASMNLTGMLDVTIQAANALAAAHAAGIVHRDIKPENIMVRTDGYVKVLDFGLAKLVEKEDEEEEAAAPEAVTMPTFKTEPGMVMGTVTYMSPEQARGQAVDARADIWSLGVVLYEMVAGRPPFEGLSSTEVIARVLEREPLPLSFHTSDAPAELQRIVTKALTKDRDRRYQEIQELLLDLKALKELLEFEAKLGRVGAFDSSGRISPTAESSWQTTGAPLSGATGGVVETGSVPRPTGSAEYVAGRIKHHRVAAIIVLLVIAGAGLGAWFYLRPGKPATSIDSIAVLPFVNQNRDPETEYLSDGLTESIINSLTQLPKMRVIARSSVFRYKGRETDPVLAGRELGVRAVLTGRVIQRGDNLTISVELVDVHDNVQLWGEHFERKVSDLIIVQREIAKEISSNLRLKLTGADESRVTKNYTKDPVAYQLYLKGRFYWNKRTGEAFKKAIEYFNQAIDRDPNYALAYAGLADVYVLLSRYSATTPEDAYPKAKAAARKALDLDNSLAEAHNALAGALFDYDWNFTESNEEYRKAIELNPNYATAHHWYGNGPPLVLGRFEEAIAEMKRAQELDPLSLIINADLGDTYIKARQYDAAIEQLQKTVEMDQNFYVAHKALGTAYEMKGSFQEAIAEYQKARQLNDDPYVLALLGHAYARSGKRDEALKVLDQLKELAKQRYVSAYSFATVYAGLGDRDQAFLWLERSYQERGSDMAYFKVDTLLDDLHSDPRFADLVRKVGL